MSANGLDRSGTAAQARRGVTSNRNNIPGTVKNLVGFDTYNTLVLLESESGIHGQIDCRSHDGGGV
jgi:hypothetical protein